jgi:PhnB protein
MAVKPIPDGFHNVTPYLFVDGVAKLLDFVKAAFDAKEEVCLHRDDGSVMHAVVRIGDSPLMMGDPTGPAAEFGPMPSSIYLYVNDCDSVYQRAIQAGGKSVMEVTDIPFNGERYGGVKDPTGNIWWIATHIKDVSLEECAQRVEAAEGKWQPGP